MKDNIFTIPFVGKSIATIDGKMIEFNVHANTREAFPQDKLGSFELEYIGKGSFEGVDNLHFWKFKQNQ